MIYVYVGKSKIGSSVRPTIVPGDVLYSSNPYLVISVGDDGVYAQGLVLKTMCRDQHLYTFYLYREERWKAIR